MRLQLLILALLAGCHGIGPTLPQNEARPDRAVPLPLPTEHRLSSDAENARKKADRKAWIAARHWAPPGVNWKALERANGERVRRGRNQLAAMAASGQAWTERGSRNQAGRVHVAAHGPDGLSLYVGSAKGGLWRGTLDGQDWVPIGDDLYGGAHWLAVLPNPNPGALPALLRGTDDGRVHLTLDDGATWVEPAGLPQGSGLRRLLRTAGPSPAAFAVARSSSSWGVYRSLDSGQSFTLVRVLGTYAGDLWTSRTTPDLLYVVDDGQLLVSGDMGATWTPRGSLPAGGNRAELTGCEAGAPRLWAVQTDGGDQRLYRSDDAGSTWSQMATVSDYWGTLSASIVDPDLFAWGGVELHRTTNGGQSFSIVNPWSAYYADPLNKLHADLPGLDVVPDGLGGEIWYPCTDGGLYRSTDGLASVENLSLDGLRISQYYTTLTSSANPDHVVAGSQDQGWQRASQPAAAGTDLLAFDQEISGDYGHAVSSDGSHDWVFTVYPGFLLVQKGEFAPKLITEDFPGGENMDWMPFLAADPLRKTDVYLCATQLWRYDKIPGADDWNLAPVSDHDFEQQPGEHLTGVAFSPLDDQRVYAVTSRGSLWVSNDRAVTWTKSSSTGPAPHYFYGTAILASSTDADTAWVGGSGYGGPAVWRTTDGGVTWQPFGTGLPPTLVYSLGEAPDGSGRLVCGTEMSVYQRNPSGSWFEVAGSQAPAVPYWSVEAHPSENVMRFGTYGRGIWDYDLDAAPVYTAYGVGLGGANDLVLDNDGVTFIGQSHVFTIDSGASFEFGTIGVSTGAASIPLLGGTLLIDPNLIAQIPFVTFLGTGQATLDVPNEASLAGLDLFLQAVILDLTSGSARWSNGLTGTLSS